MPVVDLVLRWLAGEGNHADPVRRFQQLSAPIAAKALEDTSFYRYGRLLSRNDVGFDAGHMALEPSAFHLRMQARARDWPTAMLTTATHDHKRGEDSRARLAVLSAVPDQWGAIVSDWEAIAEPLSHGVDCGDRYMLFQTLLGAWPDTLDASFGDRITAWQTKALREAKLRSSWEAPNESYEARCNDLALTLIDSPSIRDSITAFLAEIAPAATRHSLVQAALRCTMPGVPDLYQGTEFADLSLVDPDNRRPVDYDARIAALDHPPAKFRLIATLLNLRREHPDVFARGSYDPASVDGTDRLLAFERRHGDVIFRCALALDGGQSTGAIRFHSGEERDVASLFADSPVWFEMA
jgi:(1->4)-alpha-D-glucan 1-alpha-D-glucosylmutase